MDIFSLITYFFISGLVSHVLSQSCERSYYDRCKKQLAEFTDRGDLLFANSESQLREECGQAQELLKCINRYVKKCLSFEEQLKFDEIEIARQTKVTVGLCENAELKSRYFKSLPCLRNMSEGLQYCSRKYDRNQNDIDLYEHVDKTHLHCCSFDGYRRCLRMLVETQESCRKESSVVVDEIASLMGGVFSGELCAEHFERCTGAPSSAILWLTSFSLIILTSSASLLLLKFF